MEKDILSNFFGKLMPMFPPRSEAFLKSATREDLQRLNFRYIFTVYGMIEISHLIEDAIMASPGTSYTHVSFQYFSRVSHQSKRYTRVAQASIGLWLYGVSDAPLPEFVRMVAVDTTGTPLENYWFVIAYGPGIHMTLLAEEVNPVDRLPGEPRMYEGFYTFDQNFAFKMLTVLHKLFPEKVSEPILPELLE
ncbi:MAG: DICT sensory domain-containing protein [Candidatus Villigracilaceae bacterium]